ncbi:MAG: DUF1566 domain-containing protein [Pseudomonadota bacterium]|nr:DUF1566 domain-containing protein [Pseudomonadota bacterium]
MTLNDNVNVEGQLFLEGSGSGVTFADGTTQTTAVTSSWHQILSANERFELVMPVVAGPITVYHAVLDHETGLVWQRYTSDTTYTWNEAQANCYMLYCGTRLGWRLPTVDELATLIDRSQTEPSLPQEHPFTNVQSSFYWSITTGGGYEDGAWGVDFSDGNAGYANTVNTGYVRAVRSGQ